MKINECLRCEELLTKAIKQKKERELYWQNRMKSEREAWEFYVKGAIDKVKKRYKHPVTNFFIDDLLKELGFEQ